MGLRRVRYGPVHVGAGTAVRAVAWADTYTDQVAGKFQAQTHVVADPDARPALENADQSTSRSSTARGRGVPPRRSGSRRSRPARPV